MEDKEIEIFTSRWLMDNVMQITDPFGFCATLVIGKEKGLLFDTMCGVGNLKTYIEGLVDVPVTVVLSHGHFDHIGGINLFPEVFIHPLEIENIKGAREVDHADEVIDEMYRDWKTLHHIKDMKDTDGYKISSGASFRSAVEGDIFDLGGVVLKVVELPGHTEGSIGLYCEKGKYVLTGDAVTPVMCLFFEHSSEIKYEQTLNKLMRMDFENFITSHHQYIFNKDILPEFYNCLVFSKSDRGMKFQHDLIPGYRGMFHIYKGTNSDDRDFIGIILRRKED